MEKLGTSYFECENAYKRKQEKFVRDRLNELDRDGHTIVFLDEHLLLIKERVNYNINIIKSENLIKIIRRK